jgi:hypothetical protein
MVDNYFVENVAIVTHTTLGLAAVLEIYVVQPTTLTPLKTIDEDMYKSSIMKVSPVCC